MREYFSGGITMTVTDGCFRLSTDSMVLADFCRLPRGAAVCDLGSGCGALGLLLLRDHPDMRVTGLEILPDAAAQARKNIDANHLSEHFSVITGDLREHRALLPASAFDAVVSNPPYFPAAPCRDQHEVRVCARVVPHEADAFRLQPVRTERAEQIGQPLRLMDKEELAAEAQRIRRARAEIVQRAADLAARNGSCTVR